MTRPSGAPSPGWRLSSCAQRAAIQHACLTDLPLLCLALPLSAGKCYRLYTEAAYKNEMLPTSIPEIQVRHRLHAQLVAHAADWVWLYFGGLPWHAWCGGWQTPELRIALTVP